MPRLVVNPGYKVRDMVNSRDAEAGEIIDVPDKEAKVLLALRRASLAPAEAVVETPVPVAPAPEAEPAPADPAEPMSTETAGALVPPRRGRYVRRDERAEGK